MEFTPINIPISGIIPTVGRADYLWKCLETATQQTLKPREILIVHCGTDAETKAVVENPRWANAGIDCRYFHHPERNAAAQRNFAVARAKYPWLLLLDDDLELEPGWTEHLLRPMVDDASVAAVLGHCTNQPPLIPKSKLWWLYYHLAVGGRPADNEGRLVGALVNIGYATLPAEVRPIEWIGGGSSALRRSAYEAVGGFAPYFDGSSPGEDHDLGYRLSRKWKVVFNPAARAYHHSAGSGREGLRLKNYHIMRSQYAVQFRAMQQRPIVAQYHTFLRGMITTVSEVLARGRGQRVTVLANLWGRIEGWMSCWFWSPPHPGPEAAKPVCSRKVQLTAPRERPLEPEAPRVLSK